VREESDKGEGRQRRRGRKRKREKGGARKEKKIMTHLEHKLSSFGLSMGFLRVQVYF
jgi:hypothetical protein